MTRQAAFDTVIVDDLRRREQLTAMRHLRPSTHLPQPIGPLARELRDELLQLPDERDPLYWLQQERGQVSALLMLSLALDLATQLYRSAQQVFHLRTELDASPIHEHLTEHIAEQASLFGQLLTSTEAWDVPASYTESIADVTASGQLIDEWARLRHRSALPVESSPSRSLYEPGYTILLADLLRLPDTMDPLQWLQEERAELSAREVLAYLIHQSCPPPDFLQGVSQIRPSARPKAHLRIPRNLSVHVERIDFYELGFAIHLHARIPSPDAWKPSRQGTSFFPLQWKGFDRLVDNHGYHYLTQSEVQISNQLWWWQEQITLLCYPSVGDAHELVLQSQSAALAAYRVPLLGDELTPLPGPVLGEMRLSVPLH
jgi:hypothetical protein